MSDRADKLLREILAADDAFPAEGSFRRYEEAKANARAYLNEKPHELLAEVPIDPKLGVPASPPHADLPNIISNDNAAAEPEKPVAWYMPLSGRHAMIEWGPKRPDAGNINEWRPLYASPSAQPRDEQDAKRYRWLRKAWIVSVQGTHRGIWLNLDAAAMQSNDIGPATALDAAIDAALKSAGKESDGGVREGTDRTTSGAIGQP